MARGAIASIERLESRRLFAAGAPNFDHVVVVIEENRSYERIFNATDTPYLHSLATQSALFTNSYALMHPSSPNYLALFSGSTQGVTDDNPHSFTAPNVAAQLRSAGKSFLGYYESPAVLRHDPWESFTDTTTLGRDFSQFPTDFTRLSTLSFVLPNMAHDMHDGSVAAGDAWLHDHLDAYATWARTHHSLLVITWDEDDRTTNNHIPTLFAGSGVKSGKYAEHIDHYNVLRTIEAGLGLPPLGNAASAATITDVFGPMPPPRPVPPPSGTHVSRLVLVDATTGRDVMTLSEGSTFDASRFPATERFTIRADTDTSVSSIGFQLDHGFAHIENGAPYTLYGDAPGVIYGGAFAPGSHQIDVFAYSAAHRAGTAYTPLTVHFNVIGPSTAAAQLRSLASAYQMSAKTLDD